MKILKKRIIPLLIAAVLACSVLSPSALAIDKGRLASGKAAAETLNALGLFRGTGNLPDGSPSFELERAPTRGEALAMLVRLLGGEDEALSSKYAHPYTDAGWATAYVGYAYVYGITNGVSATKFDTHSSATMAQYLTFMLRALGYPDTDWRNPYPLADRVGLEYPSGAGFYRADVAAISLSALDCTVAGAGMTLREKLESEGAIGGGTGTTAPSTGSSAPGPVTSAVTEITVTDTSVAGMAKALAQGVNGRAEQFTLYMPRSMYGAYWDVISTAFQNVGDISGVSVSTSLTQSSLRVRVTPSYQGAVSVMAYLEGKRSSLTAQERELLQAAQSVHASLAKPGMSDYELVKAFHDYIINHTSYDSAAASQTKQTRAHDAVGALVDGKCVCEGYTEAFDLLCYLSGIDCVEVTGAGNGGGHAWNKVKLDGSWYNIDLTWDDPVSSRPVLRYDYFLVSDAVMKKDHSWADYGVWPAAPSSYSR